MTMYVCFESLRFHGNAACNIHADNGSPPHFSRADSRAPAEKESMASLSARRVAELRRTLAMNAIHHATGAQFAQIAIRLIGAPGSRPASSPPAQETKDGRILTLRQAPKRATPSTR